MIHPLRRKGLLYVNVQAQSMFASPLKCTLLHTTSHIVIFEVRKGVL